MRRLFILTLGLSLAGCSCDPNKTKTGGGELSVDEKQINFGEACPAPSDPKVRVEPAVQIVHVHNAGNALLYINKFEISAADAALFTFDKTKVPESIEAGGVAEIPVTFRPSGVGSFTGTLTIVGDQDGVEPTVVALLGEGKDMPDLPGLALSCPGGPGSPFPGSDLCKSKNPSAFFPDTAVNSTSEVVLILNNTGCPVLDASGIRLALDSGVAPGTFALAPGTDTTLHSGAKPATLKVLFTPKATQDALSATLTLETNDPNWSTVSITLRGNGVTPVLNIAPTYCSLSLKGTPCTGDFSLSNSGGQELTIQSVSVKGANPMFKLDKVPAAGTKIAGGAELASAIHVTYQPGTQPGSDLLEVVSSGGAATAILAGGSPPVLSANPSSNIDFGANLSSNTPVYKTLQLSNVDTYAQQLPLTVKSLELDTRPPSAYQQFSLPQGDANCPSQITAGQQIAPGSSATACIKFTPPPSGGTFVANLLVHTDDPTFPDPDGFLITLGASTSCNPAPIAVVGMATGGSCPCSGAGEVCVSNACQVTGSAQLPKSTTLVQVSGQGSYDLTGASCTNPDPAGVVAWEWNLVKKPAGSQAAINPSGKGTAKSTTLYPDQPGSYEVELFVYDASGLKGGPSSFTVSVLP